jgi:hypothetical protein
MYRPILAALPVGLVVSILSLSAPVFAAEEDAEPTPTESSEASSEVKTETAVATDDTAAKGFLGQDRLKLGARLGLAFPAGYVYDDRSVGGGVVEEGVPLGDVAGSMLPIWLEGGYMVTPNILVGLYFQYGIVFVADDSCPPTTDCSGSDVRFGVQGQYHLKPNQKYDPWFGLGIGYEWFSYDASSDAGEASDTFSGFEFLNLQGGLEVNVANHIHVGPFMSISLGNYTKYSADRDFAGSTLGSGSGSVPESAMHSWIMIGAKGSYSL